MIARTATTEPARRTATPAAGGVLWRADGANLLVALVHRPRYDDWTLPKGKIGGGEQALLAAVREVAEETGALVQVGRRLTTVEYSISDGVRKRVGYWSMRYLAGEHVPSEEVDSICWLTIAEASQRLTYPVDRVVLADFARIPMSTSTILLLRHAKAGKRSEYRGDDRLRPLDKIGRRHAREAVRLLAAFGPQRIVAADRTRCEQTVAPLAEHLSLPVQSGPEFSDESYIDDAGRAVDAVHRLADEAGCALICSQGVAIPGLLADLEVPAPEHIARKGSLWVLSLVDRRVVCGDYYPHPNT